MSTSEPDELLYSRYLKEGNEDDLRVLLERHRESLVLFLCGYVNSMEDAEELMLDAYAAAVSGTARFSGKSSFRTWLFAIGRNLAHKRLRKQRIRSLSFFGDVASDGSRCGSEDGAAQTAGSSAPELAILEKDRDRRLYQAMERLAPDYRQALYLQYFEEMTVDETARVMDRNRKQIYNLTDRGRKALRAELERMGFSDEEYR